MATRNFNVKNGLTAGNITLDASTNTTTTSNLVATGNVSFTGSNVSLGSVSNVKITGGTGGYVLSTDGSGNLSWIATTSTLAGAYVFTQSTPATTWVVNHNLGVQYVNVQVIDATGNSYTGRYNYPTITFNNAAALTITFDSAVSGYAAVTSGGGQQNVGGSNTQIQFNDANVLGGSAAFTFNKTSNLVSMGGALSVTGNANVGNLGTARVIATGNISGTQLISNIATGTAPLVVTSTTQVANLNAATAGTVTTNAQPNITSVGTLSSLAVSGAVTASTLTSNVATGTAPLTVTSTTKVANLNVEQVDGYHADITSTANNIAVRDANANIYGNNFIGTTFTSNVATGTAPLTVTSTTRVSNLNVAYANVADFMNVTAPGTGTGYVVFANNTSGNVAEWVSSGITSNLANNSITATTFVGALSGAATSATTAGTVTTAAQPNITSVSTSFTGLTFAANGNITMSGNASQLSGANLVSASFLTGTLTTAAQPNITSVGTLTSLGVNGTVTAVNFTANTGVFAGSGANLTTLNASNISSGTLAQARLANSSLTVNGQSISLGGSGTITANTTQTLSNGSYITGDSFNGGTARTWAVDATTTNTANKVVARDANGSFSANIITATLSGSATSAGTATTAGTVTTAAQPNITSVGTLTSLGVNGTVTAVAFTANTGVFTGNGSGLSAIAGANVTGTVANATYAVSAGTAGTVTTAAQPNITSVGTLTSLSVTGNVAAGNLTTTGVLSVTGTGVSSIAGNLDMTGNTIINLATPTNSTDAATKQYVDDVAQGLHTHDACQAATPDTLANISGGTVTYNNGSSGVGATLTTTGSYTTIDGVTLTNGMRILVKNEANTAHNGIYDRTSSTVLTRSTDFDTSAEMAGGDFTFVQAGTLYDNTGWVMPDAVTTVGTSAVVWVQFSGAGTYTAGTGLTLTGSQFSITNTAVTAGTYGNGDRVATFTVNSQGQLTAASNVVIAANAANLTGTTLASGITTSSLTTVGTLGTLSVTGNANVGNIGAATAVLTTGNITTINSGLLQNGNSNVTITANGNVTLNAVGGARIIATSTGANVTGTLGVSGNANVNNLGTAQVFATANVTAPQFISNVATGTAPFVVTSTTRVTNLNADLLGGLTTDTAGSNNTIVARTGNGQVVGNTLLSSIATGTAPLVVTSTTRVANLNVATAGTADSATTAGTVTTAAQPNITSVGTLTGLGVNGTVTAVNFTANTGVFTGNGSGLSAIAGANVTGTVSSATSATTAGTVTTAAQPNITSVGTLTSLAVTGNVTSGNFVGRLANGNSNVNIAAANGNVTIAAVGNTTLTVTGTGANISGTLNATGNANVNNLGTAQVLATANVTAPQLISNIATGTAPFVVTSTTQVANLNVANAGFATSAGSATTATSATTAGTVTTNAQPNITSVGTLTSLSVTGNASAGNLNTAGAVVASTLTSNVATGTAPLVVTSTTKVANLNVEQVDGYHADITSTASNIVVRDANANVFGNNFTGRTFTSNVATGTAPFVVTSTTQVANLNVANAGFATSAGSATTATSATTAGTVTTAAQPNITSVGTLTSLAVSANANASTFRVTNGTANAVTSVLTYGADNNFQLTTQNGSATNATGQEVSRVGINYSGTGWDSFTQYVRGSGANNGWQILYAANTAIANISSTGVAITGALSVSGTSNLGPVGNVTITGGSNGQVLTTNGSGVLSWSTVAGGGGASISNGTSNVNIATSGGNITMGVGGTANVVTVTSSNIQLGTGSGGNISGANVITANTFLGVLANGNSNVRIATANGNVNITAVGNTSMVITGTGANVTGTLGVSGNANVGNLGTATAIITTGNITTINSGLMQNGTSNVAVTSGGNVTLAVAGVNRLTCTTTGVTLSGIANCPGTLTVVGNSNVSNLGASGLIVATGNITGANLISTAYTIASVGTGISAAGTTQGTGTALTKEFNVVSTVASGAGVVLPTAVAGMRISVINTSANALLVYPATNGIINSQAANAAYSQPAGARLDYISTTTTQWYTLNATYG